MRSLGNKLLCHSWEFMKNELKSYVIQQIKKPEWKPDFGPVEFLPTWGATIAGARKFLIAYNINILGTKEQAHRLALNLRTQGRGPDQVKIM